MLHTNDVLEACAIGATDGVIGHVKDLFLDDAVWVIRHLVVETGHWLASREVLISPVAIGDADWSRKVLPVAMTRQQVRDSPDIDTQMPVTRQHERALSDYYGYPHYWDGLGYWGEGMYPGFLHPDYDGHRHAQEPVLDLAYAYERSERWNPTPGDPHLQSLQALRHYDIHATDGDIGRVHGLIIEHETWAIRYLILETGHWWHGNRVLVAPGWIVEVNWGKSQIVVNVTQQALREAPKYTSTQTLDRDAERKLHMHHDQSGYWPDD